MNDVRDEALGGLLDRAATRIEAEPVDRLPEVLRNGSRRRAVRFTAIGAVLALFAGAAGWLGTSLPSDDAVGSIPADIADWRTFASLEDNGWTMQVPPPWRVQELPACSNAPERIGVVVTNVDFEFMSPRGTSPECEDRLVFAGFPRDGVALAFHPRGVIRGIFQPPLDTTLPLTPDLLSQTSGIVGGPAHSYQSVNVRRETLGVIRRFEGPDATASDVAALDRMLASLRVRGAPRWVEDVVEPKNELDEDLRVTIAHPSGWNVRTYPRWAVIDAPNPLVALESPLVRPGSCRIGLVTPSRFARFRDPSAFVLISDASDAWTVPDLPPRPDHFRLGDAVELGTGGCGGDVETLQFGFRAAGRQIFVYLSATRTVFREEPEMLLHILDSIEVEKA